MHTKVSALIRFIVPATLALGVMSIASIASADPFGPGGSRAISNKESSKAASSTHSPFTAAAHSMIHRLASASHGSYSHAASSTRGYRFSRR